MTQIVINNIVGVTYPVDVYVADVYGNNKVFLTNIPTGPVPPALSYATLPSLFDTAPAIMMIVIDANGCESSQVLPCTVSQTPTSTPTPTPTPTNTQTPTNTPTPSITPSITPTQTQTPTNTPTPSITPSITPTNTPTPTNTQTPGLTPSLTPSITPTLTQTPTTTSTQTPTGSPTNTPTPTNSQTPTNTPTPTPTETQPQFYAYLFPEALDSNSLNDLGQYMYDVGATWYGFGNTGVPGSTDYSNNLNDYAHYSGFSGGIGNFITPVTSLKSPIRQSSGSGTDGYGCSQNQYTFGTIQVTTSQVNPNIFYFYSVWIPLDGVGGTMNNMTLDVGIGSSCSTNIINDGIPDPVLSQINVTVTSGAAIPAGTYRVLWMYPQMQIPTSTPLYQSIFIKGDTKL